MKIIDPGHAYELLRIDRLPYAPELTLRFVKRVGVTYPGNADAYSGTNLQSVLRACIDRIHYLNGQKRHWTNSMNTLLLTATIWLLEWRAARQRRQFYFRGFRTAVFGELCRTCGHTCCQEHR